MNNVEIIKEMLSLQKRLNDETNGLNWESGYTNNKKLISWKRCIYMECAELINDFAWKHWKNIDKPTDWSNVKIEIVDIWHFILSLILEKNQNVEFEKISNEIVSVQGFNYFAQDPCKQSDNSIYEIVNDIEIIIHKCSTADVNISELLVCFFRLCFKCGVNLKTLFKIYIGKNVLNKFRQDNGYKSGEYIKIWHGKEDNDYLSQILDSGVINVDEIYKLLSKEYNKIKNSK